MVQRMVVYDSGGDHKMLVGGWWTGADFNTTRHTSSNSGQDLHLIEMFHTYTQLAEDESCDGGLVFEIAGGGSGEDELRGWKRRRVAAGSGSLLAWEDPGGRLVATRPSKKRRGSRGAATTRCHPPSGPRPTRRSSRSPAG